MQRANSGERRKSPDPTQRDTILHFSLQGSLPPGHNLALNLVLGTLSYLVYEDGHLSMALQDHFTPTEMGVLLSLLEMFPYYCPYEALYAGFYHGNISEETVEESRKRLDSALARGQWEQEIRPIRDALSRTRIKLKQFNFDILSILATGYILNVSVPSMPKYSHRKALGDLVHA